MLSRRTFVINISFIFLFLGKLENQMQILRATMKKEAFFKDFWWHFWPKNRYLSITVHWRDNIDDKNPTNKVVVEGHYFTLLAIITYFGFDHGKILDIFLSYFVKRFSINNGCCLDPLQIEDFFISWSICLILKLCYKYIGYFEIKC